MTVREKAKSAEAILNSLAEELPIEAHLICTAVKSAEIQQRSTAAVSTTVADISMDRLSKVFFVCTGERSAEILHGREGV